MTGRGRKTAEDIVRFLEKEDIIIDTLYIGDDRRLTQQPQQEPALYCHYDGVDRVFEIPVADLKQVPRYLENNDIPPQAMRNFAAIGEYAETELAASPEQFEELREDRYVNDVRYRPSEEQRRHVLETVKNICDGIARPAVDVDEETFQQWEAERVLDGGEEPVFTADDIEEALEQVRERRGEDGSYHLF